MAEFQEVMKQRNRMCKHYLSIDHNCKNCPLDRAKEGTMLQCFRYVAEYYQKAENVIMEWAAEHPEPVYPTWEEWLQSVGVMESSEGLLRRTKGQLYIDGIPAHAVPTAKVLQPIPDDIAKKLGLDPKEYQ